MPSLITVVNILFSVVYNTLLELYMRQFKEELEAPAKPASAAGAAAKV